MSGLYLFLSVFCLVQTLPNTRANTPVVLPGQCSNVQAVPNFNLEQFTGLWHHIARYETEGVVGACQRTTYSLASQNSYNLENSYVLNQELHVVSDSATLAAADGSGRLNVNLLIDNAIVQAELVILATDYNNYALTYICRNLNDNQMRVFSWKLSRQRELNNESVSIMEPIIEDTPGLSEERYIPFDQSREACFYIPELDLGRPVVLPGPCEENAGVPVVNNFLAFMGLWYEIEHYPSGFPVGDCITISYNNYNIAVNTSIFGLDAVVTENQYGLHFSYPGRLQMTLANGEQIDIWVAATDFRYALIYYCIDDFDNDRRTVWSAKLSRTRELTEDAIAAINQTMQQYEMFSESLYVPVDVSDDACFHYPEQAPNEIVLPLNCNTDIPIVTDIDITSITGVWYLTEKYPDGSLFYDGDCVGMRLTPHADNPRALLVEQWQAQDGELVTNEGLLIVPPDNSNLLFQLPNPATDNMAVINAVGLSMDYDSHMFLYECVNRGFQRVVRSYKFSRSRELSATAVNAIDAIIDQRQELHPPYYNTIRQDDDCPGTGFSIRSSILLLFISLLMIFMS